MPNSPTLPPGDQWVPSTHRARRWNSIVAKLTLWVGALLVLTAAVLSLLGYSRVRDLIGDQIEERLQVVVGARQAALQRFVTQQHTRIAMLGRSTRIRDLLNKQQAGGVVAERLLEDTNNLLKDAQEHTPGFLSISLTDRNGKIIRSTDESLLGQDLGADLDVQAGLKSPHLGVPHRNEEHFVAWLVGPAENIISKRNEAGAVLVELELTQAEAILDERDGLGNTGRVYLAARDGDRAQFLLDPENESVPLAQAPAMNMALEGEAGFTVSKDHRGQPVLAAYRPLGYGNWGLVAQMDTDEAYAPISRLRRMLLTLAGGVLIVGLGSSYLLARGFARPIVDLAQASQAVGEGRWDTRVKVASTDELGDLATAFNRMTEELAASYSLLEDRVARRTAALAASEQTNRDQRQILESILNSMGDGVAVCNQEGKFIIFNPAGRRMLGLGDVDAPWNEWPEIYGVYLPDRVTLCPPEALPLVRALRGEETDGVELYIRRKDAEEGTWLSVTGRPMLDDSDQLRGGVVVFRNMSLQKKAERALRQSQARYMSLVESLPLAVWSKNLDGVFTFGNQLLADMLGRPSEHITGKTDFDFFPADAAQRYTIDDRMVIEQHRVIEKIETLVKPDGEVIFIQTFKAPLFDEDGRVVGTQGLCWDISDLKRTEAALRHAREEADAANRAKSAFLANISHEIRTPMNGILGITELVLDTPLSSEQRGFLSMVRESSDALLAVINDILDFSKIEAGRMELEATDFDLAEEVGDCMKTLAVRAHKKGLDLIYRIAPDVPTLLVGDSVRLRQVLTNLTGNAIKFTHEGEVIVDIQRLPLRDGMDYESTRLQFIVRDTGIGIPAEKLQRVFDAFEQADVSMTRKYGGTGLGLSISSRLIELMGGKITVESREGKGSTFAFSAQFALQTPSTPAPPAELSEVDEKHVLLVDDHPTQRAVLREILSGWGVFPSVNESTDVARRVLAERPADDPFDLVIIDAAMNQGDGSRLAQELTKHHVESRVILLVTADCSMSDMHDCRQAGVLHYLIKPVKPRELIEAMALALRPPQVEPAPPVEEAESRARASSVLRVLLVEDSEVNQTVAVRLLEKRGHHVTVIDNGATAVELLERPHSFDVVLMDVQMPVMDGLTATELIRQHENSSGRHVPIIAMTAHAMVGDRQRCLEAGMDGYVSKPVKPKDLFDAVEGVVTAAANEADLEPGIEVTPVIDWDAALERLNGDRELLGEMVTVFCDEAPKLRQRIEDAIVARDAPQLKISAHTLKGAVGNFVAKSVFEAALRLETLAKDGNFTDVETAQAALDREMERLMPALAEFGS